LAEVSPNPLSLEPQIHQTTVVLLKGGPHAGRIAVIVEIIDHNRVSDADIAPQTSPPHPLSQAIIDGPTTGVPRQSFPYRHLTLTSLNVPELPRAAGTGTVKKYVEKADLVTKWESSSWAKKRAATAKRRTLTDFERFEVLIHKKARRDKVRKVLKAAKA
jgi:large subunit ribosomal protein L14e